MRTGRTIAVVGLAVLLTVVLGAGNAVFAAHGTVLDPGFVTNALEEEDGYEALQSEMQRAVENATGEADLEATAFGSVVEGDPIREAVTPAYVKEQIDPNIDAFYAYLHGNSDRLNLTLDTRPLADGAGQNVANDVDNASISALVDAGPGDPFADVPVEEGFVADLNAGPESYDTAKTDLREQVRESVLDEYVEQAFTERSNNDLLALVIPDYNPDEYSEAEKERMVADRESEIRAALRQRIAEEQADAIDDDVDAQLETYRQDAADDPLTAEEMGDAAIASAANDLRMAVITAATTDQSYEAYREDVTTARADLADAVGHYTTTRISEEVGVVDLNEELDISEGEFEGQRTIVGYFDVSALVLPVLALLLIGGVWFASRSVVTTTLATGASVLVAALASLVGGMVAGDQLRAAIQIEGDAADTLGPVVTGIVDRTVGTFTGQSLVLALIGLLLVAVAAVIHYDVDDRVRERLADEEGTTTDGTEGKTADGTDEKTADGTDEKTADETDAVDGTDATDADGTDEETGD